MEGPIQIRRLRRRGRGTRQSHRRICSTLKELEIEKDTIVVFTSDNGPNPKEKSSPLPFRGEKWSALGGWHPRAMHRRLAWSDPSRTGERCPVQRDGPAPEPEPCLRHRLAGQEPWQAQDRRTRRLGPFVRKTLLRTRARNSSIGKEWMPNHRRSASATRNSSSTAATRWREAAPRATPAQDEKIEPYRTALKPDIVNPPILFNLRDDPGETTDLGVSFTGGNQNAPRPRRCLLAKIKADPILPISTPPQKEKNGKQKKVALVDSSRASTARKARRWPARFRK